MPRDASSSANLIMPFCFCPVSSSYILASGALGQRSTWSVWGSTTSQCEWVPWPVVSRHVVSFRACASW